MLGGVDEALLKPPTLPLNAAISGASFMKLVRVPTNSRTLTPGPGCCGTRVAELSCALGWGRYQGLMQWPLSRRNSRVGRHFP